MPPKLQAKMFMALKIFRLNLYIFPSSYLCEREGYSLLLKANRTLNIRIMKKIKKICQNHQ